MRPVDLALYADALAAESSVLAARLERARQRLREAAIERQARRALGPEAVERLERLGVLRDVDTGEVRREIDELSRALSALDEFQDWVEGRLFASRPEDEEEEEVAMAE
jgi:hypothetical protein